MVLTIGSAGAGCLKVVLITSGGITDWCVHCSGSWPTWIALVAKPFGCALNDDIFEQIWIKWNQRNNNEIALRHNEQLHGLRCRLLLSDWNRQRCNTCFPMEFDNIRLRFQLRNWNEVKCARAVYNWFHFVWITQFTLCTAVLNQKQTELLSTILIRRCVCAWLFTLFDQLSEFCRTMSDSQCFEHFFL